MKTPESEFNLEVAMDKAWNGAMDLYAVAGEDPEVVLAEAAKGLERWQSVPPSDEVPEGEL